MIEREHFREACKTSFAFLRTDYGFHLVEEKADTWGFKLLLKNDNVGIVLTFEFRDYYLFVKLCKLQRGEFPSDPGEIRPETELESYDLDDVVSIRSKESLIPTYKSNTKLDRELFEEVVGKQAANLRTFAADILRADFSLFPELEKLVKNRARSAAIQKWGDRAAEFGWDT